MTPSAHSMSAFKKGVLITIALALAISVAARVVLLDPADRAADQAEARAWWHSALPIVTEASLFALIGFALGYSTRKAFRLALILIALATITLQVLVARGSVDFEWGSAVQLAQDHLLNLEPDTGALEFLKQRAPSAIAFAVAWIVGFRRG